MQNEILFSVVIPTYNRGHHIMPTIHSLLIQSYKNFEVLVVDDGSNDNTSDVIQGLGDSRFIYFWKENGERGAARNYGAQRARGEYILFMDSDDFLHPDSLQTVAGFLEKSGKINVLTCGYDVRTPEMKLTSRVDSFHENELEPFTRGNPFACGSVFIHREVFSRFKFSENRIMSMSEDWEYWTRLVSNFGYKVHNVVILYIIDHSQRSVRAFKDKELIRSKELAIEEAFKDEKVREKLTLDLRKIHSFSNSYISLHLALAGYKFKAVRYLAKAIFQRPAGFFSRRTLAICKHLLLTW